MHFKTFWLWMVVGLVLSGTAIVVAAGEWAFFALWFSAVVLIVGLPMLAVALLAVLIVRALRRDCRESFEKAEAALLAMFISLVLLIPANFIGVVIGQWRIQRAQDGVRPSVATLDLYKEKNGHYPASFEEAEKAGMPVPQPWFAPGYHYYSNGSDFSLDLCDPYDIMGRSGYIYMSENRQWKKFD